MTHNEGFNRREFLARLGAGALLGASGLYNKPAQGASTSGAWTPPPVLKNPNILVIMVDQMRAPVWPSANTPPVPFLPNIAGRIQNNSYNFEQFYVAATMCTASRAALLTGLYAPQTAMYVNLDATGVPPLSTSFPTWGQAMAALNSAYNGRCWWFGKWHLCQQSEQVESDPLSAYGFNTGTIPGPPTYVSPNGAPNEGTDGGTFQFPTGQTQVWANDAMIANDFANWLPQAPTSGPWCATVSLVNPHDIGYAPGWLQTVPYNSSQQVYFPAPIGPAPAFYQNQPSPWNLEQPTANSVKPSMQYAFYNYTNGGCGTVNNWAQFLSQYCWLQNYADSAVGQVLDALEGSAFANNTIIIFLSDHGDFGGSHGLHDKGGAVYDEAIHVPFYVQFPGQTGSIAMNQMCSGVDFFGLMCDLATGGSGQWRLAYPDQANRQSMWSFLYNNSSETRIAPSPIGLPYIFHTFDQFVSLQTLQGPQKVHIVSMRTKSSAGAKLAVYSEWAPCTTYPDSTPPDVEFYNYSTNPTELLNDAVNQSFQGTLQNYTAAMGTLGPQPTGLTASELSRPLIGTGTDGNPLSQAQAAAQLAYVNYASGTGACTGV
jgi:arylsulfatase A-like enzyme